MLHTYLTEYIPLAIIFTFATFAIVKLVTVKAKRLPDSGQLFVESFGLYSEQYIRNTFHKHLKNYYKYSNKVNSWFYLVLGVLVAVYIFISIL